MKQYCNSCKGTGRIKVTLPLSAAGDTICFACNGTGSIEEKSKKNFLRELKEIWEKWFSISNRKK